MRPLALLLLVTMGCGSGGATADRTAVTDDDRARSQTLAELLEGRFPSLSVRSGVSGGRVTVRRTGLAPLIIVDGFRRGYGVVPDLPAADIAEVRMLLSMADTLVYGADAAERGVLLVTTRLGRGDSP